MYISADLTSNYRQGRSYPLLFQIKHSGELMWTTTTINEIFSVQKSPVSLSNTESVYVLLIFRKGQFEPELLTWGCMYPISLGPDVLKEWGMLVECESLCKNENGLWHLEWLLNCSAPFSFRSNLRGTWATESVVLLGWDLG